MMPQDSVGFTKLLKFGFARSQRLLCARDYKDVFDGCDFRASHKKVLILARTNNKTSARLGLVFGKKSIPRSVDRNRLKRITREQFRLRNESRGGIDLVVMARSALAELDNESYAALIRKLMLDIQLQQTRKQKNELSLT